jgi:hypothetical protein
MTLSRISRMRVSSALSLGPVIEDQTESTHRSLAAAQASRGRSSREGIAPARSRLTDFIISSSSNTIATAPRSLV